MTAQAPLRARLRIPTPVLAAALVAAPIWVLAQTPELIVDILTTPNRYWNRTVVLKGHVRSVAPNPPGTNRGSYVLRDSSDADLTVLTTELPAQGREYTVTGLVEQATAGENVPHLREYNRRAGTESTPPQTVQRRPAPAPSPRATTPAAAPAAAAPPVAAPAPQAPPVVVVQQPGAADGSSTLLYVVLGALAVLSVLLVAMFWPRRAAPAAPPQTVMPPPPTAMPPRPGADFTARASAAAPPAGTVLPPGGAPTKAVAQKSMAAPSAAKATELFMDLGAELIATEGPDRGKHFSLTKPRIGIGRQGGSRLNEIALNDETVSREHAKIVYTASDKSFRLINESNTNPVRVNGSPVDSVLLQDNDVLQLGATALKFRKL
jgi:hypothetical protein